MNIRFFESIGGDQHACYAALVFEHLGGPVNPIRYLAGVCGGNNIVVVTELDLTDIHNSVRSVNQKIDLHSFIRVRAADVPCGF